MANYSNYHLDANRQTGQVAQNVIRTTLTVAETSIKFLVGFVGDMIRMIMGK